MNDWVEFMLWYISKLLCRFDYIQSIQYILCYVSDVNLTFMLCVIIIDEYWFLRLMSSESWQEEKKKT